MGLNSTTTTTPATQDDAIAVTSLACRPVDCDCVLSVVTTCLNEQDNIDALVTRTCSTFDRMGVSAELVIVDDGSGDGTWSRVCDWSAQDRRVTGVRHKQNRGIEAGWRSGIAAARGTAVCLIDADLQNEPEDVSRLFAVWRRYPESMVQGSRVSVDPPKMRFLLSKGLNVVLNRVFGMHLADNKSGFLLGERNALTAVLEHKYSYRYFQCFLAVSAHARGYDIRQIDTVFHPRCSGHSFLNNMPLKVVGRVWWEVVKARVELGGGRHCIRRNGNGNDVTMTREDHAVRSAKPC